ncbi:MAG TPA: hypothetical protein VGO62_07305 [Myxococcota bacterium]
MSRVDLVDGLLALGVVTREQVDAMSMVAEDMATTQIGKLIAAGASADELLPASAQLCGIPQAPQPLFVAAHAVEGLSEEQQRGLRDLLAAPVSRDDGGVVDVIVAAPEAASHLPHLGLGATRVFLAEERSVRWLLERVLPQPRDSGPQMVHGVMDQIGMVRRADMNRPEEAKSNLELGALPTDRRVEPTIGTERDMALDERGQDRELRLDLNRFSGVPAHQPARSVGPPASGAAIELIPAPHTEPTASAPKAQRPPPQRAVAKRKALPLPLLAAAGAVIVVVIVVAIVMHKGGTAPVDDSSSKAAGVAAAQQAAFDKAAASAKSGDPAWAIAGYSTAIDLDPNSALASEARVQKAIAEADNGDVADAQHDLQAIVNAKKPGDPQRVKAEARLKKMLP